MRYDHFSMLPERAFQPRSGRFGMTLEGGSSGGGGSPQPTSTSQTTIPEYAQPYMERTLGKAEALSETPYQTYGGERIAPTAPEQTAARESVAGMQERPQFGIGSELAAQAGLSALQAGQYAPGVFAAPLTQAQQLRQFQMRGPTDVYGMQQTAPQMATAQTGFAPNLQQYAMGPAEQVGIMGLQTPMMQAAQTRFDPNLQRFQMEAPESVAGREVTTGSFTAPGVAEQFMSPYMQQALDVQKQEAIRDAQKAQLAQNLAAARTGTYGGARQTLAMTERERNLQDQLARIQATGSQSAYEAAQRAFEAEQGRGLTAQQLSGQFGMQAALANQQARQAAARENLQAALGVQQLGTTTGLQATLANLDKEQQANVQNQAAQLQTQGMSAEQALRAALANQQAGLTVGQQNLAAQLQTQQLGTQTGLQAALANLSSAQQANVQNQAAQLQTQGLNADQALRAALANQQAQQQTGIQNLQARLGVQQLGAQTGLESQRLNQQALMEAQRMAEQSRQFGAGLGLQGAQAATQAGAALGQLGIGQQQSALDLYKAQEAFGGLDRAQQQSALDLAYQDFLQQQRYPYAQLGFMSDILRGSGNLAGTGGRAVYEAPPSTTQNLMQLGLGGLGLYKAFS